jgi:hypothetical protein
MIILTEVAEKLSAILNGTDSETSGYTRPTDLSFLVKTEGFHLDSIDDKPSGKNLIPVFVSSMGGQFNPVKGLKQASYSIPLTFYYPVRFKEAFFALANFLADVFVGTILNYGSISGKAVSNINVPQYGEIQDLDFKEFEKWVGANYQLPVDVMEPYMTMNVTLFLSNAAPGLLYGNDVKVDLSFTYGENTYSIDDIDWDGSSLQSNTQAQSEQEEGTNEADGIPFGTAYGSSFKIYPNLETEANEVTYELESGIYDPDAIYYYKSGNNYIYVGHLTEGQYEGYHGGGVLLYIRISYYFYKELLKVWLAGNIQEAECKITFTFGNDPDLKYERDCFIQSVVAPIEKGQIFSLTLTFNKKTNFED